MNTSTTFNKPLAQDASNFAESAADNASGAIRSTQNVANAAFDRLNDKVESARDQVAPMISRLSDQAEAAARRGADAVKETSAQLRDKALQVHDRRLHQGRTAEGNADRRSDRRRADGADQPVEPFVAPRLTCHTPTR